ncbi:MAG TPA: dynamin family protein [Pseudonocardia sp.]
MTGRSIGPRFDAGPAHVADLRFGAGAAPGTPDAPGTGSAIGRTASPWTSSTAASTDTHRARALLRDAGREFADDAPVAARIAELERRLDEPLRVALAGTLKSGKSTLLNALVGEEIAPTDATECTRVVTWFGRSDHPRVDLVHGGGRRRGLPVYRDGGRLRLDLDGVPADEVEQLTVGWPSSLLGRYTLVDTPGTSSNSADVSARTLEFLFPADGDRAADAVVYLMRSARDSDAGLLRRLQDRHGCEPLGVIGVLSRADETGDGSGDGMHAARLAAAELRDDPTLHGVSRDFAAVSGLLAVRGQTLRQAEFAALSSLAGLPEAELAAALRSPGRFVAAACPTPLAAQEALLESFGLVGVRTAVRLVREGAHDAPALVAHSGLDELRRTLEQRFGGRHAALQTHSALRGLRAVLLGVAALPSSGGASSGGVSSGGAGARRVARLLRVTDAALADSHPLTELRVLASLGSAGSGGTATGARGRRLRSPIMVPPLPERSGPRRPGS